MKELTIKEKAKRYDEALERAKEINRKDIKLDPSITTYEYIFPELKESEDEKNEKVRIGLIKAFNTVGKSEWGGLNVQDILAWLEKQGESYTKRDVDDAFVKGMAFAKDELEKQGEQKSIWHNEDEEPKRGSLILLIMQSGTPIVAKIIEPNHTFNHGERWAYIDDLLEKQSEQILANSAKTCKNEQKPTDKVEPKFHNGQWITNGDYTWKIVEVKPLDYILQSQDGNIVDDTISHVDKQFHSFTIEDAKDGDVLAAHECLVLFREIDGLNIRCYCTYHFMNNQSFYVDTLQNKDAFHPATEEQRDILFKAMEYEGYTFDFEKKELKKKIEPKFKVGDVLEFGDHGRLVSGIVSYVNKTTGKVDVNCLLENNNFKVGNYYNLDTIKPHPATKEQRDILFQKMKEAGYEWDDEKKELKKIEQKQEENKRNLGGISSNWSEEDENEVAILEAYIRSKDWSESHIGRALGIVNELVNKCKSSKDRVQPKQEWSEEDETGLTNTIIMLKEGASLHFSKKDITKAVDWLKSLRPQKQWKPTTEQLRELRCVISGCSFETSILVELEENLKKLL